MNADLFLHLGCFQNQSLQIQDTGYKQDLKYRYGPEENRLSAGGNNRFESLNEVLIWGPELFIVEVHLLVMGKRGNPNTKNLDTTRGYTTQDGLKSFEYSDFFYGRIL